MDVVSKIKEAKDLLKGREPNELTEKEVDSLDDDMVLFLNMKPDGFTTEEWFKASDLTGTLIT